jgi:hypothetical protein
MRSHPDETDSVSVTDIEEGRRHGAEDHPSQPKAVGFPLTKKKKEKKRTG